MLNEIVITGIGPVSALGIGRVAFSQGINATKSLSAPPSLFSGKFPVVEVTGLKLDEILASQKTILDRSSEFALAAAQLALNDAGLAAGDYLRWRSGVVVGSENGCMGIMQLFTSTLQKKGARFANSILFSHMYVNTPASLCAIEFGLGGHHGTFAGSNAGEQALEAATEALQLGRADMLLAIGVDALNEPLYRAWAAAGKLDNVTLGEGACALLLETKEHAAKRGKTGLPLSAINTEAPELAKLTGNTLAATPFLAVAANMLA